jgi:histidinol-phosphate aminotransferase
MKDLKKIIHESLGRVLLELNENETVESLAKKIMQEGKLKKALSKLKPSMFGDEFSFADNVVNHMVADYVEHPLYDKLYDYLISIGIVVRNRSTQVLCQNTLRFTVGTKEENNKLINALTQCKK